MRLLFSILFLLLPVWAQAACTGTDLRRTLTPQDQSWIEARIADAPFVEGNHWIAQRGDRKIHIIGTMHFNDPRMEEIAARLTPIIAEADSLLLEMSPADEEALKPHLAKSPELMFITKGPTLIDRLPPEDWSALASRAQKHGIPSWVAAKMRPWFLGISMSVPLCLKSTKAVKFGLDKRLQKAATANETPMLSLEDPMTTIRSLNEDSLEEQVRQLRLTLSLMGQGTDEYVTLTHSYFEEATWQHLAQIEQRFYQSGAFEQEEAAQLWDQAMDIMLVRRNKDWIPVIEGTEGDNLVVAVGALHLPGETGVLNLLQQQGYLLSRAPF